MSDTTAQQVPRESPVDDHGNPGPVEAPPPGPYVARADWLFRVKRGIIVVLLVGYGLLSAWHGFVTWPRETAEFDRIASELELLAPASERSVQLREEQKLYTRRSDTDILFNRVMALLLPPVGILLMLRWLYISRGEIRLDEADTLHAPGHGAVPLAAIRALDDERWQRKGISQVVYDAAEGTGRVRLDHDWYEPKAIHAIHGRLSFLLSRRADRTPD
jgi:hypothetical protein